MSQASAGIVFFTLLLPVLLAVLTVALVITLRWFIFKERMALIIRGLPLEERRCKKEKQKLFLALGLAIAIISVSLGLGLASVGFRPWLLFGLIPFSIGLSMILGSLILKPPVESKEQVKEPEVETEGENGEPSPVEYE